MRVLIIEDENPAVEKLLGLLKKIDPEITVAGVLETVEESINWLSKNTSPELLFMDIQLDDGICFEIFETIKVDVPVIFTTAFDEYAVRAFKVNSVDYLLKPIKENDLRAALNKFESVYDNNKKYYENFESLIKEFTHSHKNRFLVKIGEYYKSVLVNEINYFYVAERNTFLYTFSRKTYPLDYSLEQIEAIINPASFFRINRKHIININSIKEIVRYSSGRLRLRLNTAKENEDFTVSRDKVTDFKKWMEK